MKLNATISAAKRLLLSALIVISAASCVHQWPDPAEAELVLDLVFDTALPQGPVVDMTTKAADDGLYDVRYIIEAYSQRNDGSYDEDTPYARFLYTKDDISDLDYNLSLMIMEGTYRFRVWADYVDAGTQTDKFYNADKFKYIKLYGKDEGVPHVGNNDYRDAFVGSAEVEVVRFGGNHPPVSATIDMARPLSKVVFITTDLDDWKTKVITNLYEMAIQGAKPGEQVDVPEDIDINEYTVKIHYPQYMPNAFNLTTDRTTWSDSNVSFESKLIQLNNTDASMGFDYIFANNSDANVVMAVSLHDKDGTQLARSYDITVPLERGKVTTVKGSFLLEESDGGVSINPDFDGEFNIVI